MLGLSWNRSLKYKIDPLPKNLYWHLNKLQKQNFVLSALLPKNGTLEWVSWLFIFVRTDDSFFILKVFLPWYITIDIFLIDNVNCAILNYYLVQQHITSIFLKLFFSIFLQLKFNLILFGNTHHYRYYRWSFWNVFSFYVRTLFQVNQRFI